MTLAFSKSQQFLEMHIFLRKLQRLVIGQILSYDWFSLASMFNGISTFVGLFNSKAILVEEQQWYYITIAGRILREVLETRGKLL